MLNEGLLYFCLKCYIVHFFNGLRLCLCGTRTANGPIDKPPGDTRVNMKKGWNDIDREIRRTWRET